MGYALCFVLLVAIALLVAAAYQVVTELEVKNGQLSRAECDLSNERVKNELWREDYLAVLEKNMALDGRAAKAERQLARAEKNLAEVRQFSEMVTELYLSEECPCTSAATSKATS